MKKHISTRIQAVETDSNFDGHGSGLWKLQQVEAELLHSGGEELHVADPLQAFHQSSGPVVQTHSGDYLQSKNLRNNKFAKKGAKYLTFFRSKTFVVDRLLRSVFLTFSR